MAAKTYARYLGSTDRSVHDSGAVEIDGLTLEKGAEAEPVEVTAEQRKRLEDLPYHRFEFGDAAPADDGDELKGDALDARVKELGIEGASNMNADEKRAAVVAAGAAQGGDS